jgi:hypothetical protein
MSFLLPQERTGVVRAFRPLDIHGDRYVDVSVELEGAPGENKTGRIAASECPPDLAPGDRVSVRFVMGVMVKVTRV